MFQIADSYLVVPCVDKVSLTSVNFIVVATHIV